MDFIFLETEEEAIVACANFNHWATPYCRRKHPAHYTPWTSQDGTQHRFIVFFWA
jgi:hypothetical protein